ncbi:MAG: polyphosphate kinase 2 family protein [Bacteroidia bacterium]|nr:polyphosphate kinase 2 family protein [Bacteroidia bacterium]
MKTKIKNNEKIKVLDVKNFKLSKFKSSERLHFKDENTLKGELSLYKEKIASLQEKLFANDKHSVLIVLQAIDAAGKDSCIKHVLSGVNPQGCHVISFKQPSKEELDHDFIWRTYKQLPERGKIGVFNRSYYEEVLVCKVHPEYVIGQNIPGIETIKQLDNKFWENRYRAINEMERHLVKNGTVIIKIFLNLGKNEQKNRFLDRINDPKKRWKFSFTDLKEREHWDLYQKAYNDMIQATSTKHAPWYVVPADDQWVSRAIVGQLLLEHLEEFNLQYPAVNDDILKAMEEARTILMNETK